MAKQPCQREDGEAELRDPFDKDFDLFSFSAIASEFARPVKYRKAAIGVAIHTDPDFDVVAAMLIGRDLQDQTFELNAVVLADRALKLLAQNVIKTGSNRRHQG